MKFPEIVATAIPAGGIATIDELSKPLENRSAFLREAVRREIERRQRQRNGRRHKTTDMEAAE